MSAPSIIAIVPAAGIGTRMKTDIPKQYLTLHGKTILEHTLWRLINHQRIAQVIVALHPADSHFTQLKIAAEPRILSVPGGETRAESVMNALGHCPDDAWALVHDAARPCVQNADIDALIQACISMTTGGAILAAPVRDTMKRGKANQDSVSIQNTVDRENLWHALTPQMFRGQALLHAYEVALRDNVALTDEASAMEHAGQPVHLVASHPGNIKITHPDDLELAQFYLQKVAATCA